MFDTGKKIAKIETNLDLLMDGVKMMHSDQKEFYKAYHDEKDLINARINRRVKTKNAIVITTIILTLAGLLITLLPYAAKLV